MKAHQTFISLKEIRGFYKQECEDEEKKFSEKEFKAFVGCCEGDFYQWLRDNVKYFYREQTERQQ